MRLPFSKRKTDLPELTWQVKDFVWLENTSTENFLLDLPSGTLRLDMKRAQRFRPDVLGLPQIQALVSEGKLLVRR
jgi:hypothetical protein